MPKKRKSGGKSGSRKGQDYKVQCYKCGRFVARSKAKAITRRTSLVDGRMYTELKKAGTIIQSSSTTKYYCISCGVHMGKISQRAKAERRTK
ncbi:MAG: 30S ribosomal protein S26e [Candidatus Thorarchaeota archaeon]